MVAHRASSLVAACACFLAVAHCSADDSSLAEAFKAARPQIAHDLRDRDNASRLAAISKLAGFPLVDSARLVVPLLSSSDAEIRLAAFEGLVKMASAPSVSADLQTLATKSWKRPKPTAEAFGVLATLLAAESVEAQRFAVDLLSAAAERTDQGRTVVIDLVDQLGTGGGDAACRALVQIATLPRCQTDFALRRSVVQSLIRLRTRSAVNELVTLLAKAEGEVRSDVVRFLTEISGEDLGSDTDHWQAWWRDHQVAFEVPPPAKRLEQPQLLPPLPLPGANVPTYYGLPITAAKIVFIIDTSSSMQGPRILAAKRELSKAVESLPSGVSFNIIAFHTRPTSWQSRLQPASEENKRSALYFLAAQSLGSKTASYDALEAALAFDAEAVYFLTDGAPTAGKIGGPAQIIAAITQLNRYRRQTINSIGIGVDSPAFATFLLTLAQQNYGRFERVDQ